MTMEKNEHAIFLDLPGGGKNGRFHSAILTTYAVDLIHFDNQLLNMLHRKQICSINVFADAAQLEKSMDFVNPAFMRHIGKDYCITSIRVIGAFHPKINFFVGDESVLVVIGSGNLTVAGHGKNHEAFTGFMIDEKNTSHRPLIEECWQYLMQFTRQCGDYERNRILHEIPENCSFLNSSYKIIPHKIWNVQKGLEAALLYNDSRTSILKQISDLIPLKNVQVITVLSPYFDENGESLAILSSLCSNAKINVLIQHGCDLPPCKMPNNKKICFYDFNETKRGKINFKTYDRKLHAKILHFKTSDSEYCVIGSVNMTPSGLGSLTKRGINDEFCILYYSTEKDFLSLLGLKTKIKFNLPVSKLTRMSDSYTETKIKVRLLSAQYESGTLRIKSNEKLAKETFLAIDNGENVSTFELIFIKDCIYETITKLARTQYICYLTDKTKNIISNKVFVNWTELLATTNPSKISRSLNRFMSKIENEGYDGMEIVGILSDIMWDLSYDSKESPKIKITGSSEEKREADKNLPVIQYNSEYDNDEVKSRRILEIDRTSRLVECIEESIRKKIYKIAEAINDEEEDGNAEESNKREIDEDEDIKISKTHIKDYGELSTSLLTRYQKMIDMRIAQTHITGVSVITKDDLNFFSLSMFAAMEICYLKRSKYNIDETNNASRSIYQKQLYESLDRSISGIGLQVFEKFTKFCTTMKVLLPDEERFINISRRTMKYAILYGALFNKFASFEEMKTKNKRVLKALRSLASIFGVPSYEYMANELEPLSERYDYVFRMSHIKKMTDAICS